MKKRLLLLLLVFLLLFSACGPNTPQMTEAPTEAPTEALQNNQTDGMTELPTNPAQSDLKPVVLEIPDEERCAMTGNCRIAETENGYYMIRSSYLFYADKSDLSNWVLVCSQPDCSHSFTVCTAHMDRFWPKDDKIYHIVTVSDSQGYVDHFAAIGLDGTSQQLVFTDPCMNGYYMSDTAIRDSFVRCVTFLKENGDWECAVVQANDQGIKKLFSADYPPVPSGYCPEYGPHNVGFSIRGDVVIESKIPLDGTPDENKEDWESQEKYLYYQVYNDSIRALDLPETCDLYGAFISGDSLWHYHMNDGFYYMDLSTGEEVKIADAAYENAYGHCIDGKHMVECSMDVPAYTHDSTEAKMRYFDGDTWHELELPEHWTPRYKFRIWAGTSDRIIFTVDDESRRITERNQELGYIMLGEDTLTICDKYPCSLGFD